MTEAEEIQLQELQEILFGMICGSGEAFYKAERYLKAERPDLYEKIGAVDENSH